MSQLDDLLARSRAPGQFVERRKFTLSREKAIEKQREFALRHPSQYVLELVQAAVFAGATYIAVDARPGSILVAWVGGRPFGDRELSNLLDYLFADRTDPATRHLVQLAVGVNAILQRKPQTLRIETGDGTKSVRVDLDHKGDGQVGVVEDPIAGTYLFAEFGGGWFQRFLGNTQTAEQELIEQRCMYTPVPILLNGRAPFGYRGTRHIEVFGARRQVHFDEEGRRGVVALHSDTKVVGYRMVIGGVMISTLPLPELAGKPLVGVICDDGLRKTADHSDIVQDWRFAKMLHAVQPHATEVLRTTDASYRPPALPRVTEPEPQNQTGPVDTVKLEPLPEPIPSQAPRAPIGLKQLELARQSVAEDSPLFWCTAETSTELDRYADPHRFAFPLLILTPGQAASLERALPRVPIHKIASRADIDFIRRVLERQARVRVHRFKDRGTEIELALHLSGDPPAWGPVAGGVPFVTIRDGKTEVAGVVSGVRLLPATTGFTAEPPPLGQPLELPQVSVRIRARGDGPTLPDDALVDRVLAEAWHLALPSEGDPHRPLLAALLGQVAVPRLIDDSSRPLGVSLPVGHPEGLRTAPLAVSTDGTPVTLATLEALAGSHDVIELRDIAELHGLAALEQRLGWGHLWHPDLAGRQAWGVGLIGNRWQWLDTEDAWKSGMTQVIFVGSTFRPRLGDQVWRTVAHPHPVLVHAVRNNAVPDESDAGWELLFRQLLQLEVRDAWSEKRGQHDAHVHRDRSMGRLALYLLAERLGHTEEPLFLPTDGGARKSLRDLESRNIRVVARHGVQVSDPWTIPLTADERRVVETDEARHLTLRYDDPPEVWTSLAAAETGWLLREQVREGGLSGWLGLRHPYDHTTGLLVRATGRLIGIPAFDRRIPCHGLLWPDGEARIPNPEQEQLLQLAGLRLYQGLVELLATERDRDRIEAAQRYAMAFVLRSAATGAKLNATARELARRVEVRDADGSVWGTLENWLNSPTDARPPLPDDLHELIRPRDHEPELQLPATAPDADSLRDRLAGALPTQAVQLYLAPVMKGPKAPPVILMASRSNVDHVALGLNQDHRLVQRGLDSPGRAQELLLLECARITCDWLRIVQRPADLLAMQQKLLAQRLGSL